MKFNAFIIAFFLALMIMSACDVTDKKATEIAYIPKPPEQPKDSVTKWLTNTRNLQDTNYFKVYHNRIQNQIQRELYDSAVSTLYDVGNTLDVALAYDSIYLHTSLSFMHKYSPKISSNSYAMLSYYMGSQYDFLGKKDSSVYWLKKSDIPTDDYKTAQTVGFGKIILAGKYQSEGKLDTAMTITLENIQLYERLRDTLNLGVIYSNLYGIYASMHAVNEAQNCLDKSLYFSSQAKDTSTIFMVYLNSAILNRIKEKKGEMIKDIDKLQALSQKWKPSSLYYQFNVNCFLALKYITLGEYARAKTYLDTCKILLEKNSNPMLQSWYLGTKAEYEVKSGKGISDVPFFEHFMSENKVSVYTLWNSTDALAEDAYLKKDYKKAFEYSKKASTFRDSVWNEQMRGNTFELEKKYQTEKKEQQILLQEQTISAKNRLILLLFISIAALIMSILAFILWQRQKLAHKEKRQYELFTKQLLESTEEERRRIAYDLHDSIGHELLNLKNDLKHDIEVTGKKINSILAEVRGISRNLHPVMFEKVGLQISIEQLIENIQTNEGLFVSTEIHYTEKTLPFHSELQLYRIIQESLSNVRKYAQAHAAKVTLTTDNNEIVLEIKDNGKGFKVQETLDAGKAFGLFSILERSKSIGAKAQILSNSTGTTIWVRVPLA